jgi:hypothetical protein
VVKSLMGLVLVFAGLPLYAWCGWRYRTQERAEVAEGTG